MRWSTCEERQRRASKPRVRAAGSCDEPRRRRPIPIVKLAHRRPDAAGARQLRGSGMTGNVPCYGGRFTPAQAYAASHPFSAAPHQPPTGDRLSGSGAATADAPRPRPRSGGGAAAPARIRRGLRGGVRRVDDPDQAVTGPVQVLVVGFDRFTPSGEVMAELDRLREAGTARLLDVLWVERGEDGTMETLPAPAGAPAGSATWRPASSEPRNPTFRMPGSRPMARRGPWPTPSRSARPPR